MESDHPVLDRLVTQALPAHSAERAGPGLATRVVANARVAKPAPVLVPFHGILAAAACVAAYLGLAASLAPAPLGDPSPVVAELDGRTGGWATRIYHKPFVHWIWFGAVIMTFGGLISLTDRRLRIGVPTRRRRARPALKPAAA